MFKLIVHIIGENGCRGYLNVVLSYLAFDLVFFLVPTSILNIYCETIRYNGAYNYIVYLRLMDFRQYEARVSDKVIKEREQTDVCALIDR